MPDRRELHGWQAHRIEGTDGSGKSTQFARLCRRFEAEGRSFQRLVFPQYDKPSSTLLKMYLQGAFGSHPSDVNAYAASTFYAVDPLRLL